MRQLAKFILFITALTGLVAICSPSFGQSANTINWNSYGLTGNLIVGKGTAANLYAPSNAWLQIGQDSTSKGLLLPRVLHLSAISAPTKGLMVYCYDSASVLVYNGTRWASAAGGGGGGGLWGSIAGLLSNQSDLQSALNAKQDALSQGYGITISGGLIKVDTTTLKGVFPGGGGTTYSAGRGIGLSSTTFYADTSVVSTVRRLQDTASAIRAAMGTGSGSVTSVGLTMPSAFSVANSPITSTGTLAVTATGNSSTQYINGAGGLSLVSNLPVSTATGTALNLKQDALVSGTNIKTINGTSILGSGDIPVTSGSSFSYVATAYVDTAGNDATAVIGDNTHPYKHIDSALTHLAPYGQGVVKLGIGDFAHPTEAKLFSNLTLEGVITPVPDWTITQTGITTKSYSTPTKLIRGSIIKGGTNYLGISNIKIKRLGIDNGPAYVTGGGTEYNCIGIGNPTNNEGANTPAPPYTLIQGIEIEDVIALAASPSTGYHSLVAENVDNIHVKNFTAINGTHGVALKSSGHLENVKTFNNTSDGIIVKSNDYAIAGQLIVDGFQINNAGTGIIIQNKSHDKMSDIHFVNGFINYCTTGVSTADDYSNGFNDVVLNNVTVRNQSGAAFADTANYSRIDCWNNNIYSQGIVNGSAGISALISDDFNRANSAITLGSATTGGAWTANSGTWGISSNRAYEVTESSTGSFVVHTATIDAGASDVTLTATIRLASSTATGGFAMRLSDDNHYIFIQIDPSTIGVYKKTNSTTYTGIGSGVTITQALNTDIQITVVLSGGNITVKKNGTTIFTGSDAFNSTATKHGLAVDSGSPGLGGGIQFDDLTVTTP